MTAEKKQSLQKENLLRTLQTWLTTAIYSFVVCYFSSAMLGLPFHPLSTFLYCLLLSLILGLLMVHWKVGLTVLLLLTSLYLIQWVSKTQIHAPILSLDSLKALLSQQGQFFSGLFQRKAPENNSLQLVRSKDFLVILISVLTNWILPIPLLNMFFLAGPLFYMEDLPKSGSWLFMLLVGLFCVYASYAFRQDPDNRDQRPPILFGLALVILTFILQAIIPPEAFFSPTLSQKLNDFLPREGGEISSFSLSELGYYPQGNHSIGGPVHLSDAPYLVIKAQPTAFYLRGSAYDHFDGKSWTMAQSQTLFRYQWKGDYYDDFDSNTSKIFWFSDAHSRDRYLAEHVLQPTIYLEQTIHPDRIVFHAGKAVGLSLLSREADPEVPIEETAEKAAQGNAYFYSQGGILASESPYHRHGLIVMDYIVPAADNLQAGKLAALDVRRQQPPRKYEEQVRALDPGLARIVYDQKGDFADKVMAIRAYMQEHYSYSLDVESIPKDMDFLTSFLTHKEGYCVYFASCWTLLMQDLGYDVRYVEGFVVPQGSGGEENLSSRVLTAKNAHAWMEAYVEGLGWYPIEATPLRYIHSLAALDSEEGAASSESSVEDSEHLSDSSESSSSAKESSEELSTDESKEQSESSELLNNSQNQNDENLPAAENGLLGLRNHPLLFTCLLILLLFVLYCLYKYHLWAQRLRGQRPAGMDPRIYSKKLWAHCKRLIILLGGNIDPPETIRMLLNSIDGLEDEFEVESLIRALEDLQYGNQNLAEEEMAQIHLLYKELDLIYKDSVSKWTWLWKDVLTVKGKPW